MNGLPTEVLRCPVSGSALVKRERELVTVDGSYRYPLAGGSVPLLIDDRSAFSLDEIETGAFVASDPGLLRRIALAVKPPRPAPNAQRARYRAFVDEIIERSPRDRPRILVVGGGTLGIGAEPLTEESRVQLIETDVFLSPRTHLVCDGHHLPFADETFDGVVIQAVLEHVLDPPRVVAEIHRVLESHGVVYAETPFMQQVHEGPYDFTRWTESGHRRLFRSFDELGRGVVSGPGNTLLWSLRYFARSLSSRQLLVVLGDKAMLYAFFWLPYLDRWLIKNPGATDGASGVYFTGSKRTTPVSDDLVLSGYTGTVGRPVRRF